MLDPLVKLSNEAAIQILQQAQTIATKQKPKQSNEHPYEYINSIGLLQYTSLYCNGCFIEQDLLFRFQFRRLLNNAEQLSINDINQMPRVQVQGEYKFDIHNTLSEQTYELKSIIIRLFQNDQKIQKSIELSDTEIKPLQMVTFTYKYHYLHEATHINMQVNGAFVQHNKESNQKDILKMQAFIKQCQDQVYEIEQQRTVVDLLNMFQKALHTARSAREQSARSQHSNQAMQIQLTFSTDQFKLVQPMKFDEVSYNKIKNPENYLIAYESDVQFKCIKQFIYQYQPYQRQVNQCNCLFNKLNCILQSSGFFRFYLLIEQQNEQTGLLSLFFKQTKNMSVTQLQFIINYGKHLITIL